MKQRWLVEDRGSLPEVVEAATAKEAALISGLEGRLVVSAIAGESSAFLVEATYTIEEAKS